MFEIGNSLREARLRQGLDLPQVEADTKIRAKYLRALEEERFELLPGETYVKGFLRTYAEYSASTGSSTSTSSTRASRGEEEPLAPPRAAAAGARARAVESNVVVVALAGIVAVTVLVVVAWKFGSTGADDPTSSLPRSTLDDRRLDDHAPRRRPLGRPREDEEKLVALSADGRRLLGARCTRARRPAISSTRARSRRARRSSFVERRSSGSRLGAPANLSASSTDGRVQQPPGRGRRSSSRRRRASATRLDRVR